MSSKHFEESSYGLDLYLLTTLYTIKRFISYENMVTIQGKKHDRLRLLYL